MMAVRALADGAAVRPKPVAIKIAAVAIEINFFNIDFSTIYSVPCTKMQGCAFAPRFIEEIYKLENSDNLNRGKTLINYNGSRL